MNGRRSPEAKAAAMAAALVALRSSATATARTGADASGVGLRRMRLAMEAGEVATVMLGGERRICSEPLLRALGLDGEKGSGGAGP